ncbi:MAG: rod shape-determining protein MreC [Chlorobiaceae bacterium]|nr:rod shape-determining protein MreC [Chlorobiaceae bacterium]NTV60000.1 rod shape-determining protein MreC [Chlorobiaceae bacterium]
MRKYFSFFIKHNTFLLFLLYCGISALFIRLQGQDTLNTLRSGCIEISSFLSDKATGVSEFFRMSEENGRLMKINATLVSRVISLESAVTESRNREKVLADTTIDASRYIMAKVVGRKFSDRENMLLIDAGRNRGIRPNMTVLSPEGLVGRVTYVSAHYSKVMPLIHHEFKVIVTSGVTNTMGILSWSGGREDIAQLEHIPISSPVKLNEQISTSDFSTFSVSGIPVGRIISLRPDKLFYTVEVKLGVDFSRLTHVLVTPLKIEPEKIQLLQSTGETAVEEIK